MTHFTIRISQVILAGLAAFMVTAVSSNAAAAATAAGILAQARAAMGGSALDRAASIHLSGEVNIAGVKGRFNEWNAPALGAAAESDEAGPFSGGQGFDGIDAWSQDSTGLVWVDGGKAGRYTAIAQAYTMNEDVLRPNRRGSVSLVGHRKDAGIAYDVIHATPPNGLPMQVWIDAKTRRIARVVVSVGLQTTTTSLSDYRRVGGVQVPYRLHTTTDTGNTTDATVTTVQINPPDIAARLTKPASHVTDYSIAPGDETSVPIKLIDNHVYLAVMLNGKGPYQFAFDTGGANVVDSAVAQALGVSASGSLQGGGVGTQTEGFSFAKISTVGVGGASIANQYFAVLPVRQGFSVAGGAPIDGLIGFEVLSRFITTFDYGHLMVTLRMPGSAATPPASADAVPFVFNGTIPQVACLLDSISGDCSVDTGSRISVSLLTPFIAAHPNVVPADATAQGVDGFGIGGAALGRLGRLASLQIGNTKLDGLIADFSVQKKGYFANPFIAANVGGGTWRRFTVTFDYPHQTMSLVPNAEFAQRETFDRSGLFLISPAGKPTVLAARPGTPAADAGLTPGDVITAIDGTSTNGMTLLQIRQVLSGPVGKTVRLSVQSKSGSARDVSLVLRDYV